MSGITGAVGQVLAGKYRLVAPIGKGGMGSVWRAEHTSLGTPVAIKLIHPELARGPGMLARFLREAQAAAKLRSVHVVQILDHGVDDGTPYIAMECLEGESLADRLAAEGKVSPEATARVMAGVCRALQRAHRLGIVHRDLKPDNVFLAREDTTTIVRVLDFGIAKLLDVRHAAGSYPAGGGATPSPSSRGEADAEIEDRTETGALNAASENRTQTGAVMGTPRYMSPEQVRGRSDVDGRSDLWALAIIAFECLTGRRPFVAATAGDLVLQICSDPIPVPSSLGAVPDGFDAWFARATKRDPGERYQNARELADALADVLTPGERWLDGDRDVVGRRPGGTANRISDDEGTPSATPGETPAATGPAMTRTTEPASPVPRSRRTVAIGGLIAAAALGGALYAGRSALRDAVDPAPAGSASAPTSTLAKPESVLACPVLEAEGVHAPAGWLGAAVAHHTCMRATWLLGGHTERTRVPAELLGLTPAPSMDAPLDPFGAPDARERTLKAAKERATAFVDGRVARTTAGYEVSLRLIDVASGASSDTFAGRGPNLFTASDDAITALAEAGVIPRQPLDPDIVRVYDLRTAEAGWIWDDNVPRMDIDHLCARAAKHVRDLGAALWTLSDCVGKGGLPKGPPPFDPTTVGTLVTTTMGNVDEPDVLVRARPILEERLASEKSQAGRVMLVQALAVSHMASGKRQPEIEQILMEAVRASPRVVDWAFLSTHATTQSRTAIGRAAHAWHARDPFPAWVNVGLSDRDALPFFRRAWELYGFDSEVLPLYAKAATLTGYREEAAALAGACRAGPVSMHPVGEAITARLEIEEGRFKAGQDHLLAAVLAIESLSPSDPRAYSPLHTLLALARVRGDERAVADPVVKAFLLEEPPRFKLAPTDDPYLAIPLLSYCAEASPDVAKRCFARFDDWKKRGVAPKSTLLDAHLDGGRAFAKGDVAAALRAWRPTFRTTGSAVLLPFDELLKVDPDLQHDVDIGDAVATFLGVPVSSARAAKRAARRGDKAKARELAERLVRNWRDADVEPPAVAEMERLLETLK